jgi:hypothetical protein
MHGPEKSESLNCFFFREVTPPDCLLYFLKSLTKQKICSLSPISILTLLFLPKQINSLCPNAVKRVNLNVLQTLRFSTLTPEGGEGGGRISCYCIMHNIKCGESNFLCLQILIKFFISVCYRILFVICALVNLSFC